MRYPLLILLVLVALLLAGIWFWPYHQTKSISSTPNSSPLASALPQVQTDLTIVAAGDIACSTQVTTPTACQQQATAKLIETINPDLVLALGDLQYDDASEQGYQKYYGQSWGKFKAITYPAIGNHDYETLGESGFFSYFGDLAGPKNKGYYSFDRANWHFIALNSNCWAVGGCQKGSVQEQWLQQDLQYNKQSCILAYWHHPLFSSGQHGNNPLVKDLWQDLTQAQVDLVLNGHDHIYERFAPQTTTAQPDPKSPREFVVGTGGRNLYSVLKVQPNSEIRNNLTFGVLKLNLHEKNYDWQFMPIEGQTFTDAGTATCLRS